MLQPPRFENLAVVEFVTKIAELQATMKIQLEEAQKQYKVGAHAIRKEQPLFQVDNKVWLL